MPDDVTTDQKTNLTSQQYDDLITILDAVSRLERSIHLGASAEHYSAQYRETIGPIRQKLSWMHGELLEEEEKGG